MVTELVEISTYIPDAVLDIRYATTNNFTGRVLYPGNWQPRLNLKAVMGLERAANSLREKGYRLVIWDAYRPLEVQRILHRFCADENYVAQNSNHCKGVALDASLISASGEYLNMGTDFDTFDESAHSDFSGLTEEQAYNRHLLAQTMKRAGFMQLATEWWHFDYREGLEEL